MLGVTYSFAQRLDKTEKKDWTKVPTITEKRPTPSDELYPGENARRQEVIQRKMEKQKAEEEKRRSEEEVRRLENERMLEEVGGHKN